MSQWFGIGLEVCTGRHDIASCVLLLSQNMTALRADDHFLLAFTGQCFSVYAVALQFSQILIKQSDNLKSDILKSDTDSIRSISHSVISNEPGEEARNHPHPQL